MGVICWPKHLQICPTKIFWGTLKFSQSIHPPTVVQGFAVVFYDAGKIIHLAINGQGVDDLTGVVIVVDRSLGREGI